MHNEGIAADHTHPDGLNTTTTGKWKHRVLNALSILFKTASLVNLTFKSINRKHYPDATIVSIDNLSFGGTGKTTLVIEIGKQLERRGQKFAIVTRGYKSEKEKEGAVVNKNHTVRDVGDEAKLFKIHFPNQGVYIGRNRQKSIEAAIRDRNKIILLDDGFQTTNVKKDLAIMLINPGHPYYYLRNYRRLAQRDDIILTLKPAGGAAPSSVSSVANYCFRLDGFYNIEGNAVAIREHGEVLMGFSALGDNKRFRRQLGEYRLVEFIEYEDHHAYTEEDIEALERRRIEVKADYLVCTEKDRVKIKHNKISKIPLIFARNSIEFNINLIEIILKKVGENRK